ncbi:diguanylate cyclase domain-containing protein [Lacticaseibacillus sp. N501-2]|uniref:diguanylate cyclase domain-containing protein n=1 Tax=Lacticaseibacillus salsurae TaxID=3367729 RepID=UPI0038B3616A
MNFNFGDLSASMWLVQTVAATFFTAGFVGIELYIWRRAFGGQRDATFFRWLLTLMPLATGAIMAYGGYAGFMDGMMFTNMALFILLVPIFDEQIAIGEYALRMLGVAGIWWMHHASGQSAWGYLAMVAMLGIGIAIRLRADENRNRSRTLMIVAAFAGIAFWYTVPPLAAGLRVDGRLATQAVGMFLVMAALTDFFWSWQWQQFQTHQQLKDLAAYDKLTNATTYQQDQADITALFEKAQADHQPLTLMALDIDRLRKINQEFGHLAGNAVLIQTAETLLGVLKKHDLHEHFYRAGGEAFNVAFPNASPDQLLPVIRECFQAIHDGQFSYEGVAIPVTASIGVTEVQVGDGVADDLYKRADDNVYASKQRGRDTITIDGAPVQANEMRSIAPKYAFFAQPIMDASAQPPQVWCNELLLRTYDIAQGRWVLPNSFDLAIDLQVQLIYQAVANAHSKNVAINLTLAQFADPQTAYALIACLQSHDGPDALTVEIVDVPDLATTRSISAIYRAAGIQIHIDDVGSDNSFELVQQLIPYVDGVKFAMQNLRQTESTQRIQERIRFWAEVAQKNSLQIILEGVEAQADIDFVEALGIHYFQGYFFAKPALPQLAA